MLLSYLGGGAADIIKPDYPHGIRSILRETLLIHAFQMKEMAGLRLDKLMLETQFAALMSPESASSVLRRHMQTANWLTRIHMMELHAKAPVFLSHQSLVKLYAALNSAGALKNDPELVKRYGSQPDTPKFRMRIGS